MTTTPEIEKSATKYESDATKNNKKPEGQSGPSKSETSPGSERIGEPINRLEDECKKSKRGDPETKCETKEREWRDLAAQEAMAWWTKVITGTGVIQIFLSAIGIALLISTLRETRVANAHAGAGANAALNAVRLNQIATEREMRAVVEVDTVKITSNTPFMMHVHSLSARKIAGPIQQPLNENSNVNFVIAVANLGRIPAVRVSIECRLQIWAEKGAAAPPKVETFKFNYIHPRSSSDRGEVLRLCVTDEFRACYNSSMKPRPTVKCFCHIAISYRDEFTMDREGDAIRTVISSYSGSMRHGELARESAHLDLNDRDDS